MYVLPLTGMLCPQAYEVQADYAVKLRSRADEMQEHMRMVSDRCAEGLTQDGILPRTAHRCCI
jgi:hypothetical protein